MYNLTSCLPQVDMQTQFKGLNYSLHGKPYFIKETKVGVVAAEASWNIVFIGGYFIMCMSMETLNDQYIRGFVINSGSQTSF